MRSSLRDPHDAAPTWIADALQPSAFRSGRQVNSTEEEAVRLAQQASEQLSQTNAAISNQAIQKAVDLFT